MLARSRQLDNLELVLTRFDYLPQIAHRSYRIRSVTASSRLRLERYMLPGMHSPGLLVAQPTLLRPQLNEEESDQGSL